MKRCLFLFLILSCGALLRADFTFDKGVITVTEDGALTATSLNKWGAAKGFGWYYINDPERTLHGASFDSAGSANIGELKQGDQIGLYFRFANGDLIYSSEPGKWGDTMVAMGYSDKYGCDYYSLMRGNNPNAGIHLNIVSTPINGQPLPGVLFTAVVLSITSLIYIKKRK